MGEPLAESCPHAKKGLSGPPCRVAERIKDEILTAIDPTEVVEIAQRY
jgi:hypothetical protein